MRGPLSEVDLLPYLLNYISTQALKLPRAY
jgi:hypothetical protein